MGFAQVNAVPPNPLPPELPQAPAEQEGVETLTRGPIHEAFANPAEPDPEPNRIVLFRLPLEADFPDPDDLADEVWVTVVHELAHHLGIDDERLRDLGVD